MLSLKRILKQLTSPLGRVLLFWVLSELIVFFGNDPVRGSHLRKDTLIPPSWEHWLGTTPLGNDTFLYLINGLTLAMRFATLSLFLSAGIGVLVGTISAYQGGWIHSAFGRLCDALNALPFFYIMLVIARFWDLSWIGLAISFSLVGGWITFAWHAREQTQNIKNQDFIWATRAMGAGKAYIIRKILIPYNLSLLKPLLALRFNYLLLSLTTLDFLGISPRPFDTASLGQLVAWGTGELQAWWLWLPSILIITWITWELSKTREMKKRDLLD